MNVPAPRGQAASHAGERSTRERRLVDIEAAARTAFARNGYDRTSIAEIAAAVGVAEATIYKYFDGKRDLLITVLRRWYFDMIAAHRAKVGGVRGTRQRLQVLIWHHLTIIKDSPDLCRLFYAEVRSQAGYRDTELYRLNREVTDLFMSVLSEGIEIGEVKSATPLRLIRDIVFGGIEHHVAGFLAGRGELDCDALALTLTDIVMDGIGRADVSQRPAENLVARLETAASTLERLAGGGQS